MWYWGGGGMFAFGAFLVLLLLAILALLVALLMRSPGVGQRGRRPDVPHPGAGFPPPGGPVPPPDALRILDERLARGDIDVTDYEARRRALTGDGRQPPTAPPTAPPAPPAV